MRILFVGGGTAGHIHPALSIAERMSEEDEVFFILREGGMENAPVEQIGFGREYIKVRGLSGGLRGIASGLCAIPAAKRHSLKILREYKPDIVFATGGYVGYPVLRAAKSLGIKTAIHESNLKSGLVTRACARDAAHLFLPENTHDTALLKLKGAITVGTPVRRAFFDFSYLEARRRLGIGANHRLIISQGGSLGAEALNCACISLMRSYSARLKNIIHIHSVGRRYFDRISKEEPTLTEGGGGCRIVPYIENMPLYLSAADLAICRAGASSIAELYACGTPAILIPSPNVKDDHQSKNAGGFIDKAKGAVITEDTLTDKLLYDKTQSLLNDSSLRKSLYKNTKEAKSERDEATKIIAILKNQA